MLETIPRHVAIMMDGNRRWAKSRPVRDSYEGHWAGAGGIFPIVKAAKERGINILTLWAFSTENWKRSQIEISVLMRIFLTKLQEYRPKMIAEGVKFSVIGALERLPKKLQLEIDKTILETKGCEQIELIIAFNYGGKDDITRAFIKIAEKIAKGELTNSAINESLIAGHLDTARWPDPDLIIRTGGENRVSNFMLWQLAYSELYITDTLWPDFTKEHFNEAILDFQTRQRRLGR